MISKWNTSILSLLVLGISGTASGPKIPVKLSIQRVVRVESGVNFVILVENVGPSSLYLEEARECSRDLYAINIELLQLPSSWKQVGPHRDVPPSSVFEVKPGDKIEKTITISDPYIDLRSAAHQKFPLRGQLRAATRYFLSESEWSDFMRTPGRKPRVLFSQVVSIPEQSTKDH